MTDIPYKTSQHKNQNKLDIYSAFLHKDKKQNGEVKQKMEEQKDVTKVEDLKAVESEGIDLSKFEGQKAVIEKVEVMKLQSKFAESGMQDVVKVSSIPITTFKDSEGKDIEIRATELFNLTDSKSWSKKGKLQNFLDKQKVDHPSKLKATTITIRLRPKKNEDGTIQNFLGFVL